MQNETLFTYFSDHLKLLIDNGIIAIPDFQHSLYICPICLRSYHSVEDGGDNPLTLEDAPPKSLGGKPVVHLQPNGFRLRF